MRGYAVGSFGEAPEIDQLPAPAADDAVLIRVTFAGVNPGSAQDAALPAWRDKCKYSAGRLWIVVRSVCQLLQDRDSAGIARAEASAPVTAIIEGERSAVGHRRNVPGRKAGSKSRRRVGRCGGSRGISGRGRLDQRSGHPLASKTAIGSR
jgi:hypothetical protein